MDTPLFQIFIIMLGAAAIPFASRFLRIPAAACEIIYGMLLFNLFITHRPEWFTFLGELGFIYLMFIAGMECDLDELLSNRRNFAVYTIIVVLSFTVTPLLFVVLGFPFYIGITVAVVSAAVIIAVLRETGMGKTNVGRHITNIAATGEIVSIAVLTGLDVYHMHGLTIDAVYQMIKLAVLLAAAVLFLRLLYVTAWWNPGWVEKVMESDDPVEEGIRILIAVAFAGALEASAAGVEAILGSFMAGMVFGNVFKSKGRFEEKINAVGFGFFTPFFFMSVGSQIDMGLLASPRWLGASLLLTLTVFVSNIFPLFFYRLLRLSLREAFCMILLISSPLSMIIVAGTLGAEMGFIDETTNAVLILTALFSSLIYPVLFRMVSSPLHDKT